jgi:hypothetical protein
MDPRDEKEDMIQQAVTAIAFVPADAENPSGCALRAHFHLAMPSFGSAVGVFFLPFGVLVSTNLRWRPQGSLSFLRQLIIIEPESQIHVCKYVCVYV